jgi:hypothetical protein
MVPRYRATKQAADEAMLVLCANRNRLLPEHYDRLWYFIKACRARLPSADAVARDAEKKAARKGGDP